MAEISIYHLLVYSNTDNQDGFVLDTRKPAQEHTNRDLPHLEHAFCI